MLCVHAEAQAKQDHVPPKELPFFQMDHLLCREPE
jgi:hypothetical protein